MLKLGPCLADHCEIRLNNGLSVVETVEVVDNVMGVVDNYGGETGYIRVLEKAMKRESGAESSRISESKTNLLKVGKSRLSSNSIDGKF